MQATLKQIQSPLIVSSALRAPLLAVYSFTPNAQPVISIAERLNNTPDYQLCQKVLERTHLDYMARLRATKAKPEVFQVLLHLSEKGRWIVTTYQGHTLSLSIEQKFDAGYYSLN